MSSRELLTHKSKKDNYLSRVMKLGPTAVATEMLDRHIGHARLWASAVLETPDEAEEALLPSLQEADRVLRESDPFHDDTTWNDHFRLMGRLAFASHLLLVDRAFSEEDSTLRNTLMDDSADKAIEILDKALTTYNDARCTAKDHNQLRGVINEYTKIPVINRKKGRTLALPGSLREDLTQRIDSYLYRSIEPGVYDRTKIQTKSLHRPRAKGGSNAPFPARNVVFVYASDFRNRNRQYDIITGEYKDRFPVSNLLVREHRGEHLKREDKEKLFGARMLLLQKIHEQRNSSNTDYFDMSLTA